MMLVRFAPLLLILVSACAEKSTATYDIDETSLQRVIGEAQSGDGSAQERLVFHYRLRGNKALAEKWHSRCLALKEPKCLIREADKYILYPEPEITSKFSEEERKKIALDLIDQAIRSAKEPEKSEWQKLKEVTSKK